MRPASPTTAIALIAIALFAAACGKKDAPKPAEPPVAAAPAPAPPAPLAVASIDLGKGIDSTQAITGATAAFAAKDTIYASVSTSGAGTGATIGAKWSWVRKDGTLKQINETSQTITTTGPSHTEFHLAKASAWPKGTYRVEITLNGAAAGSKDFTVQ